MSSYHGKVTLGEPLYIIQLCLTAPPASALVLSWVSHAKYLSLGFPEHFSHTKSSLWSYNNLVSSDSTYSLSLTLSSQSWETRHTSFGFLSDLFPTTLPPTTHSSLPTGLPFAVPLAQKALPDIHTVCSPTSTDFHSILTLSEKASLTFYITI